MGSVVLTILGLQARGDTARARVRRHADSAADSTVDVVTCTVETDEPYRIVSTHTTGNVAALVARLAT